VQARTLRADLADIKLQRATLLAVRLRSARNGKRRQVAPPPRTRHR
jgi:hypothetical protein